MRGGRVWGFVTWRPSCGARLRPSRWPSPRTSALGGLQQGLPAWPFSCHRSHCCQSQGVSPSLNLSFDTTLRDTHPHAAVPPKSSVLYHPQFLNYSLLPTHLPPCPQCSSPGNTVGQQESRPIKLVPGKAVLPPTSPCKPPEPEFSIFLQSTLSFL